MVETLCPVCGFDLGFLPWCGDSPSEEICPSCGIQFGYDDFESGGRERVYAQWRDRWMASGMQWCSKREQPAGWNPVEQVRRVAPGVSSG